ncbi:DUF4254 domain-containing protein [Nocardia thailandica]|uniref:DUF4254 domain-containing protein n=1 Tax=Nocardia thailandica TaxID=257275 RepID=UPI0005BE2D42|nr:DUF4254 domain-containing protein [Nocardia thailandica]
MAGVHHAYHQGQYRHDDDFAADRQQATEILDSIALSVLPPADPRLPSHTETVGAVIDRMAAWCTLLRHPIPLTDTELVTARAQVEQLGRAYTTLARQLARGTRRVPTRTDLAPLPLTGLRQIRRHP